MITLKIPYTTTEASAQQIHELRKQFSSVVRFAFNRFKENQLEKDVRAKVKNLNNVDSLGSWLQQCAVLEGKAVNERNLDRKVVFGGVKWFKMRISGKINHQEFQEKRLLPLNIQGEASKCGNRLFDFRGLNENKLIFKLNRMNHLELELQPLKKNWKKKLELVQMLTASRDLTVSVRLNEKFVYLSYEEPQVVKHELLEDMYMGIDLNPNHIGICIRRNDQVVHVESFDFSKITGKIINESNSSDSKIAKHLNNKLNHECIEVAKVVHSLALKHQCKFIFVEDLKKIDTGDSGFGKKFNRLTRNLWKRSSFTSNLEKRCNLNGIKLFKVNPMYSSVIGNLQHDYFDPCNAATEIARRGHDVIIKKNKKFYPEFGMNSLKDLWKKHLGECKGWREVFEKLKNLKLMYRVSLKESNLFGSFKLSSWRSGVLRHKFIELRKLKLA